MTKYVYSGILINNTNTSDIKIYSKSTSNIADLTNELIIVLIMNSDINEVNAIT